MIKCIVARLDEIPPGTRKLVYAKGRPIAIFNLGGEFFGLHNRCPHEGGSLCHGAVTGLIESNRPGEYRLSHAREVIRCPWHGWEFDIRTGQSWCEPERIKTRNYTVKVEPGERLVAGPYVAETVPVTVDGAYITVEI
ncbi:Rieske (2Fe-2S) protein [Chelatococcus sp. GCM10030263]|uniref:Rieske (2Fe-2S) protein n=1 Tax=Chelatococcus sp. GCM10030263 TaxID=3273387 RepID=UPI00361C53ED